MIELRSMKTLTSIAAVFGLAAVAEVRAEQSILVQTTKPLVSPFNAIRSPLAAPGASRWEVVKGGRVRLVTTRPGPDGHARAALQIELEPGFKTYWHNPGIDGIPPQVSFFGSANVEAALMKLPPPHVFRDKGVSVGYKGSVEFPIAVRPERPEAPYRLVATGVLGFCADICVPVPLRLRATSAATSPSDVSFASKVVEPSKAMHLKWARYDAASGRLAVEAAVPNADVLLELVVANPKGPDGKTIELPPAANAVHQKGDGATFIFEMPDEVELENGQPLDFTLVVGRFGRAGRIGVEQRLKVRTVE